MMFLVLAGSSAARLADAGPPAPPVPPPPTPDPTVVSYFNKGGRGNRLPWLSSTNTNAIFGGAGPLFNGQHDNDAFFDGVNANGRFIEWTFPTPHEIAELTWVQSGTNSHGQWKIQYHDGSTWQDAGPTGTLGGQKASTLTSTHTGRHTRWRVIGVSGSENFNPDLHEIELKCASDTATFEAPSYDSFPGTGIYPHQATITSDLAFDAGTVEAMFGETRGEFDTFDYITDGQSGRVITVEFDEPVVADQLRWTQTDPGDHGSWVVEGSYDGVTFVEVGAARLLGQTPTTNFSLTVDAFGYLAYRLRQVAGTTSDFSFVQNIRLRSIPSSRYSA